MLDRIRDLYHKTLIHTKEFDIQVADILFALTIVIVAFILLRSIKRILREVTRRKKLTIGQEFAYYQLAKYFIVVLTVVLVLETLNQDITILLAGSAALLVGIGLGVQQLFNDLVSGFFLLFEDTVRVDDIIEVDGMVSKVKQIGIRTSKVVNRDGIHVIIPNSKIVSNTVINWSTNGTSTRFSLEAGVAYGSDVQLVKKVLLDCAERHNEVLNNPKSFVRFTQFADSSLNFELMFWSKSRFRIEDVKSDLRFMIYAEFARNGISIPFPQRDIHIRSDETKTQNSSEEGFSL
jgi:small-conductance mechanosensitive channel